MVYLKRGAVPVIDLSCPRGAAFSEDRRYRYALWRIWGSLQKPLLMIGLNPSTANELTGDATITRMMTRAAKAGFGGLLAANLYGYVSKDPTVLLGDGDFVGPENDAYLAAMIELSGQTLCGWGSFRAAAKRAEAVLSMIPKPYCLGVNRDGQPTHPLYISYDVPMVGYR